MSTAPKTVAARKAARAEVTGEPVTFEHAGQPYTIDGAVLKSLDVLEAFEDGRVIAAMKTILGDAQWATFRKTGHSAEDLSTMYEAASVALGVSGN